MKFQQKIFNNIQKFNSIQFFFVKLINEISFNFERNFAFFINITALQKAIQKENTEIINLLKKHEIYSNKKRK